MQDALSVGDYFTREASYWKQIYKSTDIYSLIYQERHDRTLRCIDSLSLPPDARILEIGCGSGRLSVALAMKGFTSIESIDQSTGMLSQARAHAEENGVLNRVAFRRADVYDLPYAKNSFDLVVALGVLPWLDVPERGISEMSRVAKPGGFILATADNQWRLNFVLDPRFSPVFSPLRGAAKNVLGRFRLLHPVAPAVQSYLHSIRKLNKMLLKSSLELTRQDTLGFGPFTLFGFSLFPKNMMRKLNGGLQVLADKKIPFVRWTGSQYLVVARKKKKM